MPEVLVVDHCDSSILHLVSASSYRIPQLQLADAGWAIPSDELTTMPRGASVEACKAPQGPSQDVSRKQGDRAQLSTSYSMIMPLCTPSTAPSFMCHQQTSGKIDQSLLSYRTICQTNISPITHS